MNLVDVLAACRPALAIDLGAQHAAVLADAVAPWEGQVLAVGATTVPSRPRLTVVGTTEIFSALVFSLLLTETRRVHHRGETSLIYCDGDEAERALTTYGAMADVVGIHAPERPEACQAWAETRLYDPYAERFALAKPPSSRFWTRRIP